jgi:hypothetical protein
MSENSDNSESQIEETSDNMEELIKKNYEYPETSDPDIQYKLYKKREFHYNKIPERPVLKDYNDIKDYRDKICGKMSVVHKHQAMLSNFINPETPYKGLLLFHGLGSGKCVLPETQVTIIENNNIKELSIKNIWNNYKKIEVKDPEENGGIWANPCYPISTYSMDKNKIIKGNIIRLFKQYIDEPVRKIIIYSDTQIYSIITTLQHKLYINNKWSNKPYIYDEISIYQNDKLVSGNILNIEYFNYTGYVYDLEVEKYHNFVGNNILCHNTCAGISIAEKFKSMVQKYNTKIYILVNGPLLKENWKKELIAPWCTGETYMKYQDKSLYIDKNEEAKKVKDAMNTALQYYRFMSYRSFYKRVLGEKIIEKKVTDDDSGKKVKITYRKNEEGEFERDISVDRIYNLNNSLIIVDEAHNLTTNNYGEALKKIIHNSFNLKVILLTATPMKNLASDIVELLNFIRPKDHPIIRDRIFTTDKIDQIEIKDGGLEYFKNMARGYISHIRGADPLTYAKRVDKGVIPEGLIFTKVIRCQMMKLQRLTYNIAIKEIEEDTLDRKSEAVANFVFPVLTQNRKEITGVYGREGLNILKNQLKTNPDLLNKKIGELIFKKKEEGYFISLTGDGKSITGKIFHIDYLKYFSTKFYKAMKKINRLVWGKKGPMTGFVYSNLVKVGIDLFHEILIQNGYLEFQENSSNYRIKSDTVCYYCGKQYKDHSQDNTSLKRFKKLKGGQIGGEEDLEEETNQKEILSEEDEDEDEDEEREEINNDTITESLSDDISDQYQRSASSTDYQKYKNHIQTKSIPNHQFYPATFLVITGKSSEESAEYLPEDKKNIIDNVYNKIENKEGKYIKLILGSKVMNEGISLKNVGEVHILDVYFNLGKVDQTIGRAIRWCSHYNVMNELNQFPIVNVYRYVISLEKGLSSEEDLYRKAEAKYLLIKKVERAMKEVAIDCPLNFHGNIFKEEVEQYKDCGTNKNPCPAECDYTKCNYTCEDLKLNSEYYDPDRNIYKLVKKENLDTTTFTNALARGEVKYAKTKIKELYLKKYVYTIETILDYVKNSYNDEARDLFDEFFVYKALDELIPLTQNDFNNYNDTILDKFNRQGYLIYVDKYYIFQPDDQNEDIPMYYRTHYSKEIPQNLSLLNYLKNLEKFTEFKNKNNIIDISSDKEESSKSHYDFDSIMDYYDNRNEYKYVGIIDKEINRRKSKLESDDIFKIRENRAKILDKKRGTGIPSLHGAVCATAKSKEYLNKVAKDLDIKLKESDMRTTVCEQIRNKLLELEKYATGKNKMTYIMIPADHPTYEFPYNLEDRVEYISDKLNNEIKIKFDLSIKKNKDNYIITIKDNPKLKEYNSILTKYKAKLNKNEWIINIS